jgi:chemotaxis protein MotA
MLSSILGYGLAIGIIWITILTGGIPMGQIKDNLGLMIVLGGTFSASLITFTYSELKTLITDLKKVVFKKRDNESDIILQVLKISELRQRNLAFSLEDFHPFIADGVRLLENDFDEDGLRLILTQSIVERKNRHLRSVEMLKTLAKYPTAFGMMGTVLGLVSLLNGLSYENNVQGIGPSMSIALLTTLYGLITTNWVFHPIAENLLLRSEHDIQIRKMILQGMILLRKGFDPIFIQEAMNAYLAPRDRKDFVEGIL